MASPLLEFDKLRQRIGPWHTRRGLFAMLLLVFVVYLALFPLISTAIKELPISEATRALILVTLLALVLLVATGLWVVHTRLPSFPPGKAGVLLALPRTSNSEEESDRVSRLLLKRLSSVSETVVKLAPPNIDIASPTQAHAYRESHGATVVIWGEVDKGRVAGEMTTVLKRVVFSYKLNHTTPKVVEILGRSVELSLAGKQFFIREMNDVIDRDIVASNIEHTARYVASLSLASINKYEAAIKIARPLHRELSSHPGVTDEHTSKFIRVQASIFSVMLCVQAGRIGGNMAYPETRVKQQVADFLSEALAVKEDSSPVHLGMAVVRFWNGNISEAIAEAEKSRDLALVDDPAPYLSLAFLHFYQGSLHKGWMALREALRRKKNIAIETLFTVLRFYDDVLEREPDHWELFFPLGILNKELLDLTTAVDSLGRFCERMNQEHLSAQDREIQEIAKERLRHAHERLDQERHGRASPN